MISFEAPEAVKMVEKTLRGLYAHFLVQEFIAEAKGADLRCFVVGGGFALWAVFAQARIGSDGVVGRMAGHGGSPRNGAPQPGAAPSQGLRSGRRW